MKAQGFGGRRLDLAEEGRRRKSLDVSVQQVRDKVPGQLLGALGRLQSWCCFAKRKKNLILADGLGRGASQPKP
jgi:hypothetical protein